MQRLRPHFKNAAIDPSEFFFFLIFPKAAFFDIPRAAFSTSAATIVYLSCVLYKCGLKHVYSCVCLNAATSLV